MSSTSWAVLFFFKARTGRSGLVVWIIDRKFSKIKKLILTLGLTASSQKA
jgi:hypothetical protein